MLTRYVVLELIRNPRRTLATMVGVSMGVGLFCAVLFFIDGLSASMTQRAAAPLAIDMQRIVTERVGGALELTQTVVVGDSAPAADQLRVELEIRNTSRVATNDVTVRSVPGDGLIYVPGSAKVDGEPVRGFAGNPLAHGPGTTGLNLGRVGAKEVHRLTYLVDRPATGAVEKATIRSAYSSRESVSPIAANEPAFVPLADLARTISQVDGVAYASQLSIADLGPDTLSTKTATATGPARIFGFDAGYARHDKTVDIVDGALSAEGGVISAEAAKTLKLGIGDTVAVALPDGSTIDVTVEGIADLTRARSLFSSRRGGDLETFIYTRNSITVSPGAFADTVLPAYERAATQGDGRLKNPPIREIDVTLDRDLLDADPSTALLQTERLAADINAVASHQDYLLDNISNTLTVAAADSDVAKRLFIFLGLPGSLLAAALAAYAGSVLAAAQRREQAMLRVRGASRRHLLRMLSLRTTVLTAVGAAVGLVIGYLAVAIVLDQGSLSRASTSSLLTSALIGTVGGFVATGSALYLSGRRSIDRELNEDRARFSERPPMWRRFWLDGLGAAVAVVGTVLALRGDAFDGAAGSVYFGRAVDLNLPLLVLPITVWITGSLLAARFTGSVLGRGQPRSSSSIGRPLTSLYRLSIGRRPWPIGNGAVVVALIVALAVSLATFTASYDAAKAKDARYATGSDIRITPSPTSGRTYGVTDSDIFRTAGIAATTPVIYGVSNVILRSARTSDPANLAAIDPETFSSVAPLTGVQFSSADAARTLRSLRTDPTAVLLSRETADFLKAKPGDPLNVLLMRATPEQVEVELHVVNVYERLPGFPEGVDAVMSIDTHTASVPSKTPDLFLAATTDSDAASLHRAVVSLQQGPGSVDPLQIGTRTTTLARDQSSLAALNIAGLVELDSTFALGMAVVTIAIFVFGLLLQRRREYVTLRAQGLEPRTIRLLIAAEASTVAAAGTTAGLVVGAAMGLYFTRVLRPLFVLDPAFTIPLGALALPTLLVFIATVTSSVAGSRLVSRLEPTELLRDE